MYFVIPRSCGRASTRVLWSNVLSWKLVAGKHEPHTKLYTRNMLTHVDRRWSCARTTRWFTCCGFLSTWWNSATACVRPVGKTGRAGRTGRAVCLCPVSPWVATSRVWRWSAWSRPRAKSWSWSSRPSWWILFGLIIYNYITYINYYIMSPLLQLNSHHGSIVVFHVVSWRGFWPGCGSLPSLQTGAVTPWACGDQHQPVVIHGCRLWT